MNRSARCIQMLQLLSSRGFLTREQIANELETNIRNIAEFRKELETAGYIIDSSTGKYGGYELLNACLLPASAFQKEEQQALQELQEYLTSHPDFRMRKEANRALDKVLSSANTLRVEKSNLYLLQEQYVSSQRIKDMIKMMEEAQQKKLCVELSYRTLHDKEAGSVQIHPYEIVNYKGAYYCLAYSLKAKAFRNYKFSEERMKEVRILSNTFVRDRDFDIKKHIGKIGLIKGDIMEVQVRVRGGAALLVAEKQIGMHPTYTWEDEQTLLFKTLFEGLVEAKSFVLSLGASGEVLQPLSLRVEMQEEIEQMQAYYK